MKNNYIAFIAFLMVLISIGCKEKEATSVENVAKAKIETPTIQDVPEMLIYPGHTNSMNVVDLVARVSGTIEQTLFKSGDKVSEGQLLYVIEPQPYKDKVTVCEASLSSAQASYDYLNNSYDRIVEAAKTDAVSELDVLEALSRRDQAAADIKTAQANLDIAKTNLSYCYIKAPISGQVELNQLDPGNYVSVGSGQSAKLNTIYDNSYIKAYFNMEDEKYISLIKKIKLNGSKNIKLGKLIDSVYITIDEAKNLVYYGAIDYIAPSLDITTGTIEMRASFGNKSGELRPGMYVKVHIPKGVIKDAITVPETALGTDQSGRYMYIVNDSSRVEYRSVEVGVLTDDNMRVITEGLEKDERFIAMGLNKVRKGQKVEGL